MNTDHLALQLGRTPTRAEVAREFVARGVRAGREVAALVRRGVDREGGA